MNTIDLDDERKIQDHVLCVQFFAVVIVVCWLLLISSHSIFSEAKQSKIEHQSFVYCI